MIKVQIRINMCGHGDTFSRDSVLHVRYGLAVFELLSCTEQKSLREYCNIQSAQDGKRNVTFIFFSIFHDECISLIYSHGNSAQDSNGFHIKSSACHVQYTMHLLNMCFRKCPSIIKKNVYFE